MSVKNKKNVQQQILNFPNLLIFQFLIPLIWVQKYIPI